MSRPNVKVENLPHEWQPNVNAHTVTLNATAASKTLAQLGLALDAATVVLVVGVENADVRFCPEGTPATANLGQRIYAGDTIAISRAEASNGTWINATGTAAVLQVSQYTR